MNIGGMSNNYTIPVSNVGRVTPVSTDNTVDSSAKVKTPGVIRPEESYAKVSSHEREHVANAIAEGSKPGAELISVSVSLKMGVCPECGRVYVAGGVTNTQIQYSEENPYEKNRKSVEGSVLAGSNVDAAI